MPTLVPRPDGRGALYNGGVPGNKGGRPPNAVRAEAVRIIGANLERMETIIQAAEKDTDRVAAFNAVAKLMPQQVEDVTAPALTAEERRAAVLRMLQPKK